MPHPQLSPEQAVAAQLDALRDNDTPWVNHGLLTMYEFAEDVGGMERSRFFGYSKDLYHFDHFMGEFGNKFRDIIDHEGYSIVDVGQADTGVCEVLAHVQGRDAAAVRLKFVLKVKDIGRKKGSWMTATLTREA